MVWIFQSIGKKNSNNKNHQFWQQDNHPIELSTIAMIDQRLHYILMNPVKERIIDEPEHNVYSSAKDYSGGKGTIDVDFFIEAVLLIIIGFSYKLKPDEAGLIYRRLISDFVINSDIFFKKDLKYAVLIKNTPRQSLTISKVSNVRDAKVNWENSSRMANARTSNDPKYILRFFNRATLNFIEKFNKRASSPYNKKCPILSPKGA